MSLGFERALVIAKVWGRKARFCGVACRDGFREDRRYGAIYSAKLFPGYGFINPEPASILDMSCVYCNADVAGRIPRSHFALAHAAGRV